MKQFILVINPGSTSTKLALYEQEHRRFAESLEHTAQELSQFQSIPEQGPFRKQAIVQFVQRSGITLEELAAVVGRGGLLPPVKSGAYQVNARMVDTLTHHAAGEHASNLGAILAYDIAQPLGIPAYIYDAVAVDELEPVARITGLKQVQRVSLVHTLNMRSAVLKTAEKYQTDYTQANYIVAHLGGGISVGLFQRGKMADIVSDDEGPMSPERAGRIPTLKVIDLCFDHQYDKKTLLRNMRGGGGLTAHLGTNQAVEVEKRIAAGDEEARQVYYAMAYQVAKGIGEMATVVGGQVDHIILTGGMAHSKLLTGWLQERVAFIAPVELIPGENEMEALALGALRVLRGQEQARIYEDREVEEALT